MAESQLKSRLRALMQEVVKAAQEADGELRRGQRAVAIYNTERDDRVTALPSFAGAADELASVPQFVAAAGRENASRIVLQLTYDYPERLTTQDFDEAAFEDLDDGPDEKHGEEERRDEKNQPGKRL